MTTVCAIRENGELWLGCDTLMSSGSVNIGYRRKWIVRDGWAMTMTGSTRGLDLIEHRAKPGKKDWSDVMSVADHIRQLFRDDDWEIADGEPGPKSHGGTMLIGSPKGLWQVDTVLGITPIAGGRFFAIGSGCDFAMGAAHVTDGTPENIVGKALMAARCYDQGTGGDLVTMRINAEGEIAWSALD